MLLKKMLIWISINMHLWLLILPTANFFSQLNTVYYVLYIFTPAMLKWCLQNNLLEHKTSKFIVTYAFNISSYFINMILLLWVVDDLWKQNGSHTIKDRSHIWLGTDNYSNALLINRICCGCINLLFHTLSIKYAANQEIINK